ncbi:MAG: cation ABC transporter substrate-binding protein [Chloroflexi bacterium HGW-Chloroflexi-8]|jgi:zinc transport system substrate-binding protein|nr:MAG: cation ABC transporter substrate-binding protein [Chloroflexi bacterium HGW-Chloroflexi-8]
MKIVFNKEKYIQHLTNLFGLFLLFMMLLIFTGCQSTNSNLPSQNVISVSIIPQKYFVERLAGDHFSVNVLVQPGQSPENYEPSPAQMRAVTASSAYIQVGAPFEAVWVEKIKASNPDLLIFDSSTGIERMPLEDHFHASEETTTGSHSEKELDPHIWTSPQLVKIQSQNITDLLIQLDPAHEQDYRDNLTKFLADIDQLDQELKTEFKELTNRKFMVYHPAWGYFARDYGLEQIAIEIGGTEPSAKEMSQIINLATTDQIKVIFVQPEFSTRSAETIATEIDGKVIPISSLEYDWLENLRSIGRIIAETLVK